MTWSEVAERLSAARTYWLGTTMASDARTRRQSGAW